MEQTVPPPSAVIQLLPTDDLLIPEWNPRKYIEEGPMRDLMAHIQAGGFVDRILVWGGDGKSVISGQRRLLAYRRLGKAQIEAEILDISLEEARKRANTSNQGVPLYWLDRYTGWEPYLVPGSGLTDEQAATTVGVNSRWIRRARKLLGVLNADSRRLIRESLLETPAKECAENKGNNGIPEIFRNATETLKKRTSENPEKWVLVEDAAFQLTAFWDKRSLQDAQVLVEKALPVILSRQMSGPQVKALVKWMADGGTPEAFGQSHPTLTDSTPVGGSPLKKGGKESEAFAQSHPTLKKGDRGGFGVMPSPGSGVAQGVLTGMVHQTLQRLQTRVEKGIKKWVVWAVVCGVVWLVLNYLLPPLGSTYMAIRFHAPLSPSNGQNMAPQVSAPPQINPQPEKPALSPSNGSNGPAQVQPNKPATTHRVPAQAVGSSQHPPLTKGDGGGFLDKQDHVGPAPLWATADADYVSDFAAHFFRISYVNWPSTLDYFKGRLDKDYFPAFQNQYFPPTLKSQMEEKRLVQTFWPVGAPKLLGWEGESDEYLVRGTHSLEDHYNEPPQTLSKEMAGVVVKVVHDIDTGKRVVKVTLATPEELTAAAAGSDETRKGTDVGKQIGDTVNDLKDAVNKADEGKSALDKARGLLGF